MVRGACGQRASPWVGFLPACDRTRMATIGVDAIPARLVSTLDNYVAVLIYYSLRLIS